MAQLYSGILCVQQKWWWVVLNFWLIDPFKSPGTIDLLMLSRLVITFLPRSKCLLISWLQAPSAVILEPKKIVCHCFHCFPIYLPWNDGTRWHDLSFLSLSPYYFLIPESLSWSRLKTKTKTKVIAIIVHWYKVFQFVYNFWASFHS